MYLKRNDEKSIIMLYLGDYTKQFYLREISRLTKIPLKTTQNLITRLEKNKTLKSRLSGKNKYFRLNLENIETKYYLLQTEQQKTLMFLENHPECKTFAKQIKNDAVIIIFGSFAKQTMTKHSDIDVMIITKEDEKLPTHLLPYKVQAIKLSAKAFLQSLEKKETLIKEIEENHVIINNHSWYVNTMWSYYGSR